jgi:inorganic pyrophosphatase
VEGTVEHSSEILAFIEIPRGSRNKYEYDHVSHSFRLDRVLYSSVHYPADYGFIPETLAPDGDPLDILVLVQEPTFPGCLVPARPVGGLDMRDEKGSDHWAREIETFFATYKLLEEKTTEVLGWHDAAEARTVIDECRERFRMS